MARDDLEFGEEIPENRSSLKTFIWRVFKGPERPKDEFPKLPRSISAINGYKFTIERYVYYALVAGFSCVLILCYSTMIYISLFSSLGYHGPNFVDSEDSEIMDFPIVEIPCGLTEVVWAGHCGINGNECTRKFNDEKTLLVKCPAFCDKGSLAFSPIIVQDTKIQYEPFLVEGQDGNYRADSFPCAVGLHRGLIGAEFGGVFGLHLKNGFTDKSGDVHAFPGSFNVFKVDSKYVHGPYFDNRWNYIIAHVILMVISSFLIQSNSLFYALFMVTSFLIVGFLFDPAIIIRRGTDEEDSVWSLISLVIGRLTITGFLFKCLWDWVFAYMFHDENNPIIRVILTLSIIPTLCYNATIDRLPIDRLIWSDIMSMKGGLITILCLILVVVIGVVIQAWAIWKAGWFHKAFVGYISTTIILLLISMQSHLKIRLHHWVIGLLLLPGCKTRSQLISYIFAGILLGLIINGIARWGFASIIESTGHVTRDKHTSPIIIESIQLISNIAKAIGVDSGEGLKWWFNDIFIGGNVDSIQTPYENGYLRVSMGSSAYLVAKIESDKIVHISKL